MDERPYLEDIHSDVGQCQTVCVPHVGYLIAGTLVALVLVGGARDAVSETRYAHPAA